ncbi:unnamed protein product [Closterium sp. Naga37s-1]|nr:unnamed protein product [Closterium sp. Naga37s-1]
MLSIGPSLLTSRSPIRASLRSPIRASLGSPTRTSLGSPTCASIGSPTCASLGSPTPTSLGSPIRASLGSPTRASFGSPIRTSLCSPTYASLGSPTHAFRCATAPPPLSPHPFSPHHIPFFPPSHATRSPHQPSVPAPPSAALPPPTTLPPHFPPPRSSHSLPSSPARIHVTPSSGPAWRLMSNARHALFHSLPSPPPPHQFLPQCTSRNPQHPHTHLPPFLPSAPFLHLLFSSPTSVRPPPITAPFLLFRFSLLHCFLPFLRPCTLRLPTLPSAAKQYLQRLLFLTHSPRFPTSHLTFPCRPAPHPPRPHRSLPPLAKKSLPPLAKQYVLFFLTDHVSLPLLAKQYVLRLLFLTEPVPAALILHRFPSCATSLPSCLATNPFRPALTHRSLPLLAKMYVLRLLFLTYPVPATLVADWPKPEAHSKHKAALDRLQKLHLLLLCSEKGSLAASGSSSSPATFRLNPTFQQQLQQALTSSGPHASHTAAIHSFGPRCVAASFPSLPPLPPYVTSFFPSLIHIPTSHSPTTHSPASPYPQAVRMHLISPPPTAGGHAAAFLPSLTLLPPYFTTFPHQSPPCLPHSPRQSSCISYRRHP